jgi:hypothetical protein
MPKPRAARALASLLTGVATNLLATLVAGIITGAAGDLAIAIAPAHAQTAPAAAAAAAADNCLAKPNGPTPNGSRWKYHVERHTGRKCWYLRAEDGAADEAAPAKPRVTAPVARPAPPVVAPAAAAPAVPPLSRPFADVGDSNRGIAPPPAPNPATAWPSAPALQSLESTPTQLGTAAAPAAVPAGPPVDTSAVEAPSAMTDPAPAQAQPVPARPPVVAPSAAPAPADDAGHLPALLGIGFAVFVIILGSLAVGWIARLMRRRRRNPHLIDLPDEDWQAQLPSAPVTAGPRAVIPPSHDERPDDPPFDERSYAERPPEPRDDGFRRYAPRHVRSPQPRAEPERPAPRRAAGRAQKGRDQEEPDQEGRELRDREQQDRELARELDDNVRELLTRLSAETRSQRSQSQRSQGQQPQPKQPPQPKPRSQPKPPPDLRVAATGRPPRDAPPLHSSPVGSVDDRAAALYAWRGRKR